MPWLLLLSMLSPASLVYISGPPPHPQAACPAGSCPCCGLEVVLPVPVYGLMCMTGLLVPKGLPNLFSCITRILHTWPPCPHPGLLQRWLLQPYLRQPPGGSCQCPAHEVVLAMHMGSCARAGANELASCKLCNSSRTRRIYLACSLPGFGYEHTWQLICLS